MENDVKYSLILVIIGLILSIFSFMSSGGEAALFMIFPLILGVLLFIIGLFKGSIKGGIFALIGAIMLLSAVSTSSKASYLFYISILLILVGIIFWTIGMVAKNTNKSK